MASLFPPAHPTGRRARRGPSQRGAAALETAMVMPVFFGALGMCMFFGLGSMARMQMMELVHQANRSCVVSAGVDVGSIKNCITSTVSQLASQPYGFIKICDLGGAQVQGPVQTGAGVSRSYTLKTTLQCSFSLGLGFVRSVPGGGSIPTAFTMAVGSTVPYIPPYAGP